MAFQGIKQQGTDPLQLFLAIRQLRQQEEQTKQDQALARVKAMQEAQKFARDQQAAQIEMLTKLAPLMEDVSTEAEAASASVKPATPETVASIAKKIAEREFGTTNVLGAISGEQGSDLEFTTNDERNEVLSSLLGEARTTANKQSRDEAFAGVDSRLARLSAASGIPVEELSARVGSNVNTAAFERNRDFALRERQQKADFNRETRAPVERVERALARRDKALVNLIEAKTDGQRQKYGDELSTYQNLVNRLSGGESAITQSENSRKFAFQAARNVSDLKSMSSTIDGFIELIDANPEAAGVQALVAQGIARAFEVGGDLSGMGFETLVADAKARFPGEDRIQRLPENEFQLQAAEDLSIFSDILALKVAQTSSPDRFAYALFERFADRFDFTGVRGAAGVRRKLRAAKSVVDSAARNTESNLRPALNQPFFNPMEKLSIESQLRGEMSQFMPESIQFNSLERFRKDDTSRRVTIADLIDTQPEVIEQLDDDGLVRFLVEEQ